MESQTKQAMVICLRLLAATAKSRSELAKKLLDKGFDAGVIETALGDLERQGLLSDRAYAKNLVSKFTHMKPSGSRKISFELKRHGVPSAICEEVLANLPKEEEIERAKELASNRLDRLTKLEPMLKKKKLYDFLIRRGFELDVVREVVEQVISNREN